MDDASSDAVSVGTWAKVTGFVPGEEEIFHIVSDHEADPINNKIPASSPLAKTLIGAKEGKVVLFHTPSGQVELTVLELGRS